MGGLLGALAVAGDVPWLLGGVRNVLLFGGLIAPALTPPEPKDWSAKRRFKAAKKSSKPPALFASMLKRI